jgi:hypothetical protein
MNVSFFWILWGFDALITLVVVYFFLIGLGDGSVSSRNMMMWVALLAVVGGVLGGGYYLYTHGQPALAKTLLWLLAAPGLIAVLFMLVVIISKPRWN